ncbi:MAG: AAA family ATPase [Bacilli bacterium]|nr:AAA family ATPase [Bacilli bacterium]
MYLKEIEVSGFKSFADKLNINLDNKITCIVGPNGSGKSNVVDAIRFVLGEQSVKSLRGDNLMSDVIFGGSKNRSPMHVASVSLTFDNTDNYLNIPYQNVSVKRRLYKTGENEYFLNGDKCRLKDIVDLFLDSSIGRDSFNIIGQGEISKILSTSPYERRLVIEEAAGILKYKKRREEAFKKLDKTNLNLERVNDIITEVEERVIPLKKQSEKAKSYLEYKSQLEKIEVALLAREISDMNLTYQDTKEKIKTLNETILKLNTKLNDPEIDELKLSQINIEKEIQKLNNDLIIKSREKEELNSRRILLKERSKYEANDIKIHENISYLKEEKLKLESTLELSKKELHELTLTKEKIENNLNNLIDSLNTLKTKKENTLKEYNYKDKENLNLLNKIEILKSNISDNVYLNSNVKKVIDNPRLSGIHDALINLVKTDNKYQKCLDVATLSNKNFLIVDTGASANLAIEFLKSNHLGRVTFLPLDVIKGKYIDFETKKILENESSYLGVLSDFITYRDIYKDIILNQFGNIIVTNNLDNANRLSKLIKNKYRVMTLDGDIIHVGGSITGGSAEFTKNLSGVKNELNELELKLNLNKNILENSLKEINNLESEITSIDNNIYHERTNLISLIDNLKVLNNKVLDINKKLEDIVLELKTLDNSDTTDEISKLDKLYYDKSLEVSMLEKDLNNLIKEKDLLQTNILEKEGINKVNQSALQKEEKELNNLNILLSKLDTSLDNNLNILNNDYSLTYERAKNEYVLEIDKDEARSLVSDLKVKLKSIGMVNIDSIKEYENVNERYTYLTSERDDLLHAKEMLYSIIEEMDDVMQDDFKTTFEKLQIEFKKVFKEMFKGGDASLKLTDPNNLLETGVEIIASPPGKKLKTISLMSGGEKTLTAISLLFAILNIRSVPFCVFDEVEAALDEANVDNFGEYLNNYQDKTQFLLITHKKRTMEYAKTLYGITMQESGVSKLVSVKLEDN